MRVKNGPAHHRRRNKVLKRAKGFRGRRKNAYRVARMAVDHAMMDSFRDRRRRKREMRALWIVRLGSLTRENGIPYSRFVKKLKDKKIILNRKMLANMAAVEPQAFLKIVETVK